MLDILMFRKMPAPLEHVLIVDTSALGVIDTLYGKWSLTIRQSKRREIDTLGLLTESVNQHNVYISSDGDFVTLMFTTEEDYTLALLAKDY